MPGRKYGDFRDLKVWQQCREIRREIWHSTKTFPNTEKFRLSDQMIRSSRSATDCIAEGYGRFHYQENIQFCRHARGSLFELMNQVDTALDCGYINGQCSNKLIDKIQNAIRTLNGYIRYLQNQKEKAKPKHSNT